MTKTPDRGLNAAEFRAICTALWGVKYVAAAAAALGIQEQRVRFWSDDKQDTSKFRSSPSIRVELERMFLDRVSRSEKIIDRINTLADAIEYLDDLVERSDALPDH
jgi:hypothetical protein